MTTNNWRSTTRDGTPVRGIFEFQGDYMGFFYLGDSKWISARWSPSGRAIKRTSDLDLMPAEAEADPYAELKAAHARGGDDSV